MCNSTQRVKSASEGETHQRLCSAGYEFTRGVCTARIVVEADYIAPPVSSSSTKRWSVEGYLQVAMVKSTWHVCGSSPRTARTTRATACASPAPVARAAPVACAQTSHCDVSTTLRGLHHTSCPQRGAHARAVCGCAHNLHEGLVQTV